MLQFSRTVSLSSKLCSFHIQIFKLLPHQWQHLPYFTFRAFISLHINKCTNAYVLMNSQTHTHSLSLPPLPPPPPPRQFSGLHFLHTHTHTAYQSSLQRRWSLEQWWWFPQDRPHTGSGEVQPCSCPPRTAHSYYLLCHSNTPADNPLKSMETCLFLQYVLICCVM